jgi:cytoskeletal protein CcmA (bactofilin family)
MWGRRRTPKTNGLMVSLGPGCEIEGRCRLVGVALIDGRVTGDSLTADELIIADGGSVTATVRANVVIVRGAVTGNIVAADRVELTPTAHVIGDIETPLLTIVDGAVLEGHCRITKGRSEPHPGPLAVSVAQ